MENNFFFRSGRRKAQRIVIEVTETLKILLEPSSFPTKFSSINTALIFDPRHLMSGLLPGSTTMRFNLQVPSFLPHQLETIPSAFLSTRLLKPHIPVMVSGLGSFTFHSRSCRLYHGDPSEFTSFFPIGISVAFCSTIIPKSAR